MKIKLLNDLAKVPTRADNGSAGYDLYAASSYDIEIEPHKTVLIGTGISVALPEGTFGAIFARSGLATKRGLAPANKVGVVDESYRGEVMVAMHNHSNVTQVVEAGERMAQLVIVPYVISELEVVEELDKTERGDGGFGSTGTH